MLTQLINDVLYNSISYILGDDHQTSGVIAENQKSRTKNGINYRRNSQPCKWKLRTAILFTSLDNPNFFYKTK